jgi:hypothetical protein
MNVVVHDQMSLDWWFNPVELTSVYPCLRSFNAVHRYSDGTDSTVVVFRFEIIGILKAKHELALISYDLEHSNDCRSFCSISN